MTKPSIDPSEVRFFSGSSNPQLAGDIAKRLGVPLEETHVSRFSNDNLFVQLGASVRYRKVYIVQSLSQPVNDHLVELLMMLDIARSAAAAEAHAIIPYYSFARSDKKDAPRISITARLVADLLKTAGATHVMTMMLHSPQVHGFFDLPTDHLSSRPRFQGLPDRTRPERHHHRLTRYGTGQVRRALRPKPGPARCCREQGTRLRQRGAHQRTGRQHRPRAQTRPGLRR